MIFKSIVILTYITIIFVITPLMAFTINSNHKRHVSSPIKSPRYMSNKYLFTSMEEAELREMQAIAEAAGGIRKLIIEGGAGLDMFNNFCAKRLANAVPRFVHYFSDSNPYFSRPDIEKELTYIRDRTNLNGGFYHHVAGPQGAGKSAMVSRVLDNPGTVTISISRNSSPASIVSRLLSVCDIADSEGVNIDEFRTCFRKAQEIKGSPIIIVFEMNCGSNDHTSIATVRSAAKALGMYATVVIVSEYSNGLIEFGLNYEPRQLPVWVENMSNIEALGYAKNIGLNNILTDDQLEYYFNTVGTSPLEVLLLTYGTSRYETFDQLVKEEIENVQSQIAAFQLKTILTKLRKSPDGVSIRDFDSEYENGIMLSSPECVFPYMKNVILYHRPSYQYRFTSNAFKTAIAGDHRLG